MKIVHKNYKRGFVCSCSTFYFFLFFVCINVYSTITHFMIYWIWLTYEMLVRFFFTILKGRFWFHEDFFISVSYFVHESQRFRTLWASFFLLETCLSVCICYDMCLSAFVCVCPPAYVSFWLITMCQSVSICVCVCLYVCLFTCIRVFLAHNYVSVCPENKSVCLCFYLHSVYVPVWIVTFRNVC